ncbi:hypothetical protein SPWS13_0017 [Shewanella putrefaciens]|nr:hypothetical protein SPWS13_0017 [Shewanella putrefaciens]
MLISALSFSISIMLVPIMWVKGMLIAMALILLWYLKSIPEVE